MKNILALVALFIFTVNVSAQETKKCCSKKEVCNKTMTPEELAKCKAKCKEEGKKCDVSTDKKEAMKSCEKTKTPAEAQKCKTEAKKCCSKK